MLNVDWQSNVRKIGCIPRYGTQLVGISGTFQKALEPCLRRILSFALGCESIRCISLANNNVYSRGVTSSDLESRKEEWLDCKGFYRTEETVRNTLFTTC